MNKSQTFELWQNLESLRWTPDKISDIDQNWHETVIDIYRSKFRRKISDWNKAYSKLIEKGYREDLELAIKPYQEQVKERYEDYKAEKEATEELLKEFAKVYIPEKTSELFHLKTAESWAYSSQPSHNKYARESLAEDIKLLNILGFETEVKAVNGHMSEGMYPSWWENYELWGNLSKFDFKMLKLSGQFISVLNWAVLCWQRGTNPKVYFQFLSDDDYEKSQVLAYQTNYEVNKENMQKELSWAEIESLKSSGK